MRIPLPNLKASLPCIVAALCFASPFGKFESDTAISEGEKPGSVEFNSSTDEFTVMSSGGDIGGKNDSFHYVWRKISGDGSINADVRFTGGDTSGQRKAAVMIRQSLDPRSAFVAAVLHGDGTGDLRYRVDTGAASQTDQITSGAFNVTSAVHLSLTRRGDAFTAAIGRMGKIGGPLPTRDPVTVTMNGPVYLGLAVSAHDPAASEAAVFGNVSIQ